MVFYFYIRIKVVSLQCQTNQTYITMYTQEQIIKSLGFSKVGQSNSSNKNNYLKQLSFDVLNQNATTIDFFNKLNNKYPGLYVLDRLKMKHREMYSTNTIEIISQKPVDITVLRIKRNDGVFIDVKKHIVEDDLFVSRDKNFKMFVSGCGIKNQSMALVNINTAHKMIQKYINTKESLYSRFKQL